MDTKLRTNLTSKKPDVEPFFLYTFYLEQYLPKDLINEILLIIIKNLKPPSAFPITTPFHDKYNSASFTPMETPTRGIVVGKDDKIYVSFFLLNYVAIYTPQGQKISKLKGEQPMDGPYGLCTDTHFNILVCDNRHQKILIFDSEDKFVNSWSVTACPQDVAVSNNGSRVIVSAQDVIFFFTRDGALLSKFGKKGKANSCFESPLGLVVDNNDQIYVADRFNHRIQIFDSEGNFLKVLEGFRFPWFHAVDSKGNLAVACERNVSIVSTLTGEIICHVGDDLLDSPCGVAFNQNGDLIVGCPVKRLYFFSMK